MPANKSVLSSKSSRSKRKFFMLLPLYDSTERPTCGETFTPPKACAGRTSKRVENSYLPAGINGRARRRR